MSKKYDVILADPPWAYEVWNKDTGHGRSAEAHYSTMKLNDIAALPIGELTAENCALFMWAVWPSIFDAEMIIDAWGFTYRTKAWSWVKSNKNSMGFFTGMGHYTRANDEPCLLAVKGSMPVSNKGIQGLIFSPVREHSRKPDDQYRKIEALYPNKRYLELFARRRRDGWDAFGNEVDGSIELK